MHEMHEFSGASRADFWKRGGRDETVKCPGGRYYCGNCGSCIPIRTFQSHTKKCY